MMSGVFRGGDRLPALGLFLVLSAVTVAALGLAFRLDGALNGNNPERLYLLTWLVPPFISLIGIWRIPLQAHARLAAFGAGWLAFAVWTMRLADAPLSFNRLLAALLAAFVVGVVLLIRGQRALWGAIAALCTALLVTVAALLPLTQSYTDATTQITARTAQAITLPATPNTLTWTTAGIRAIYLNGNPTVGAGEADLSTPQTLTVDLPDAFTKIMLEFAPAVLTWEQIGLWMGAVLVLIIWGMLAYRPGAWSGLVPLGVGVAIWPFTMPGDLFPIAYVPVALVLALAWLALRRRWTPPVLPGGVWDLIAVIAVLSFGFNLALPYDRHHYNFFIGPVNDVLNGRTMFVDGINQYGMLITYLLAPVFSSNALPLSYHGFSFLVGLLMLAQFGVIYALLRLSTRNRALSVAGVTLMALVTVARAYASPYTHPSAGPLRYGLLFLLVLVVALRTRHRRFPLWPELAVTTLAAVWSLETGLFVWALYAALVVLEQIATAPELRSGLRAGFIRLATVFILGALALGGFALFTRWRGGAYPDWPTYIEFFRVYGGVGWLVDLWSPWLPVMALSYAALAGVLFVLLTAERNQLMAYVIPLGVAVIGVMQLYYWVRVPFTVTLSAYTLPALFLAIYAVHALGQTSNHTLRHAAQLIALVAGFTIALTALTTPPPPTPIRTVAGELAAAVREGRTPSLGLDRLISPPTTYREYERAASIDTRLADTVYLIETYAPQADELLVLVPPETATDALIRTGKSHRYPTSHLPIEEMYNPLRLQQVRAAQPDFAPGEVVLIQVEGLLDLSRVQREQWTDLMSRFALEWLEVTPSNVAAVRLQPLDRVQAPQPPATRLTISATLGDNTIQAFDGVEMVQVEAGCFTMGANDGYPDERPAHEVCVENPFWLDRSAVSNEQFTVFNGAAENTPATDNPAHPRTNIMWIEAVRYCAARGGRLPTEAEWEYAARGTEGNRFPWGDSFDGGVVNGCDTNCTRPWAENANDDGYAELAPVNSFADGASWAGAVGMVGNTWEWTSSRYDPDHFPYPYDATDGREVHNAVGNVARTARGGAWDDNPNTLRASTRAAFLSFYDVRPWLGFRCARDATD